MATAAVASTITPSLLSLTTFVIAPVTADPASAGAVYNGLYGHWISDQLVLPGTPVTGSVIRWSATVPAGTTFDVFTSINNGASWDVATNGGHVGRLQPGDTVTRSVIVKAVFTRVTEATTSPKLITLELQVSCDTGTYELVPIGYGMVDKVTPSTSVSGGSSSGGGGAGVTIRGGGQTGGGTSVKVHVVDPSRWIKLAQWEQPYTIPAGINYGAALKAMVLDRLPSQELFSIVSTTRIVPSFLVYGADQGSDAWQDIRDVATAYGFECFFDDSGVFVAQPVPDPRTGEAVYEIDQTSNPVVTDAKRELSDDKIYNYIVGKGESTSSKNPINAFAFDDDPSSRTYVGLIGKRTFRQPFNLITDQDQLQEAVNAILYNSLGTSDTVTISMVPVPFLVPGDVIRLNIPEPGVSGSYMIQSRQMPFGLGAMVLVCFRQTDREVA